MRAIIPKFAERFREKTMRIETLYARLCGLRRSGILWNLFPERGKLTEVVSERFTIDRKLLVPLPKSDFGDHIDGLGAFGGIDHRTCPNRPGQLGALSSD